MVIISRGIEVLMLLNDVDGLFESTDVVEEEGAGMYTINNQYIKNVELERSNC